jgi:GT2 family glycosyltransferase
VSRRDGRAGPTLAVVVPATNQPPGLDSCLAAIAAAADQPEELIVVRDPAELGPAAARNVGAREASADVLVFLDADVEIHADAFARIRAAFAADPELTAVFGSYDDNPSAPGPVSGFRNLLHHWVHTTSEGPATTFWAGLGAVRRAAFLSVGGFDEDRFTRPSIEDVELGLRLTAQGARIRLDPGLRGTHTKRWTVWDMVRTDFTHRGVPWVRLMLRSRSAGTALNLGWRHRLSAAACVVGVVGVTRRKPAAAAGALAALVALNRPFYGLLVRRRGPLEAGAGVALHVLHHLTSAAAVPAGIVAHWLGPKDAEEDGEDCY